VKLSVAAEHDTTSVPRLLRRAFNAIDAFLACDLDGRDPIRVLEDARDDIQEAMQRTPTESEYASMFGTLAGMLNVHYPEVVDALVAQLHERERTETASVKDVLLWHRMAQRLHGRIGA
jgi:hypothetical protein